MNEFLKFIVYIANETIDLTTRKQSIKNIRMIVSLITKSTNDNNLLEFILNSTFEFFTRLNFNDIVDHSVFFYLIDF